MSILTISGLTKRYGNLIAVNSLDLTIEKGNIFGILGPNGSGKTTTLAIIMGILSPDGGNFKWFGDEPTRSAKARIGALIEVPYFYPYLSAEKNLKIIAEIKNISSSHIERVLRFTHLWERKNTRYEAFSLGMKQRLALAAVLLGDPEVIVLDEPTNGLDPEGIAEIREIIKIEASKGKTIILASHILDEVEKVCSHVAVLKSGKLISQGKVKDLLASGDKIIVSSENMKMLYETLATVPFIKNIEQTGDELVLTLAEGCSAQDVNRVAFEKNIMLTKLVTRQKSLESQFLELVK